MKISEDMVKAIKSDHEELNKMIRENHTPDLLHTIESEIQDASETCNRFGIEVTDEEITLFRYIIACSVYSGFLEGKLYESNGGD